MYAAYPEDDTYFIQRIWVYYAGDMMWLRENVQSQYGLFWFQRGVGHCTLAVSREMWVHPLEMELL